MDQRSNGKPQPSKRPHPGRKGDPLAIPLDFDETVEGLLAVDPKAVDPEDEPESEDEDEPDED